MNSALIALKTLTAGSQTSPPRIAPRTTASLKDTNPPVAPLIMQEQRQSLKTRHLEGDSCTNSFTPIRYFVHNDGVKSANCQQCGDLIESLELTRCFYCAGIICWKCWDDRQGVCRGCYDTAQRWEQRMNTSRQASEHKTGRPKRLCACPHCHKRFGSRELRKHKPVCAKPEVRAEVAERFA